MTAQLEREAALPLAGVQQSLATQARFCSGWAGLRIYCPVCVAGPAPDILHAMNMVDSVLNIQCSTVSLERPDQCI